MGGLGACLERKLAADEDVTISAPIHSEMTRKERRAAKRAAKAAARAAAAAAKHADETAVLPETSSSDCSCAEGDLSCKSTCAADEKVLCAHYGGGTQTFSAARQMNRSRASGFAGLRPIQERL